MKLYSIFDVKAQDYQAPFEAPHDFAAQRSIVDLLSRNPESNRFAKFREDYILVRLADFDAVPGVFGGDTPTTITTLSALYDMHVANKGGA